MLSRSFLGLVLLGRVDGEFGEEFSVEVDDAHVAVGDEEHDAGVAVAAADAEVHQFGVVAEGDFAGVVDAVSADSMLGRDDDSGAARCRFGSGSEGLGRRAPAERPVWPVAVVAAPRGAALYRSRSGQGREERSLDLMADP